MFDLRLSFCVYWWAKHFYFIYEIESASISANHQIEYVFCFVIIMLDPF